MTPDDFKAWRSVMGFNQIQAAEALGLSKSSIELYEKGTRRDDGRPVEIPLTVALACSALYHKNKPWGASEESREALASPALTKMKSKEAVKSGLHELQKKARSPV